MSGDAVKILQLAHRLPWPPIDGGKKGTLGFVNGYRDNVHVAEHRLLLHGSAGRGTFGSINGVRLASIWSLCRSTPPIAGGASC